MITTNVALEIAAICFDVIGAILVILHMIQYTLDQKAIKNEKTNKAKAEKELQEAAEIQKWENVANNLKNDIANTLDANQKAQKTQLLALTNLQIEQLKAKHNETMKGSK